MAHTALPWKVVEYENIQHGRHLCGPAKVTVAWFADAGVSGIFGVYLLSSAEAIENAEFTERAVNSHYDLLAACKAALGAFERGDCIDWTELQRAIDKAEGKAANPDPWEEV